MRHFGHLTLSSQALRRLQCQLRDQRFIMAGEQAVELLTASGVSPHTAYHEAGVLPRERQRQFSEGCTHA